MNLAGGDLNLLVALDPTRAAHDVGSLWLRGLTRAVRSHLDLA